MKHCKVDGCEDSYKSKGYCFKHYFRVKRHGTTDLPKTPKQLLIEGGKNKCPSCKETKELSEFNKDNSTKYKISAYCRDCNIKKGKKKYAKNKRAYKNSSLRRNYSISIEDYEVVLEEQNHRCAICLMTVKENGKRLAVDHCHRSSKIRGLLCRRCNMGIGVFKDDISILQNAISYLRKDR